MRLLSFSLVAGLAVLLAGCCTCGQAHLTLPTVGPGPHQIAAASLTNGTLVVYSAFEVGAAFNSRDSLDQEYSNYKILTPDGKLLRRVHNNSDDMLQQPVSVKLPGGKYLVVAHANGYGVVTVPVLVVAGKRTSLHLEGGLPEGQVNQQTNMVCLPDGRMIGYKASAS